MSTYYCKNEFISLIISVLQLKNEKTNDYNLIRVSFNKLSKIVYYKFILIIIDLLTKVNLFVI